MALADIATGFYLTVFAVKSGVPARPGKMDN